jgi:hypothetical protein
MENGANALSGELLVAEFGLRFHPTSRLLPEKQTFNATSRSCLINWSGSCPAP